MGSSGHWSREGKLSLHKQVIGKKNTMATIISLAKSYFTQIRSFQNLFLKVVLVKKFSSNGISSTNQISARIFSTIERAKYGVVQDI
jgi:hypothetical protein